jgi:hypothetical protein
MPRLTPWWLTWATCADNPDPALAYRARSAIMAIRMNRLNAPTIP